MPNNPTNYFARKTELAEKAANHISFVNAMYADDVQSSVENTELWDFQRVFDVSANNLREHQHITMLKELQDRLSTNGRFDGKTDVILANCTTVEAVFNNELSRHFPLVLNFASYKNPGGMFLQGSSAQEESLCHASTLYNVLAQFPNYYKWNNKNLNNGLYTDRALVSPIMFIASAAGIPYGIDKPANVITCAAPNWKAASMNSGIDENMNLQALGERIQFIFKVARLTTPNIMKPKTTIILGAFGCGVFRQDAANVAKIMINCINAGLANGFSRVIFAIPRPENNPYNYDAFSKVINEKLMIG